VRAVVLEHAWAPFLSFRDENYVPLYTFHSSKEKPFINIKKRKSEEERERERKSFLSLLFDKNRSDRSCKKERRRRGKKAKKKDNNKIIFVV